MSRNHFDYSVVYSISCEHKTKLYYSLFNQQRSRYLRNEFFRNCYNEYKDLREFIDADNYYLTTMFFFDSLWRNYEGDEYGSSFVYKCGKKWIFRIMDYCNYYEKVDLSFWCLILIKKKIMDRWIRFLGFRQPFIILNDDSKDKFYFKKINCNNEVEFDIWKINDYDNIHYSEKTVFNKYYYSNNEN